MIERLRIDMKAYGAIVEFRKVEYLMDRLFELDLRREAIGKFERIGFPKFAIPGCFIDRVDGEILSLQSSDRDRHPASLLAMVMDSRDLAAIPADRHQLKSIVLEDKIPSVKLLAPEKIFLDRVDLDRILAEEIVDRFADESLVGYFAKTANKVVDGDSIHLGANYLDTEHTEG